MQPSQLRYLRSVFLLFEAASRLKVNLVKSVLIPVGNVEEVTLLAGYFRVWDCLFAGKVSWSSFGGIL